MPINTDRVFQVDRKARGLMKELIDRPFSQENMSLWPRRLDNSLEQRIEILEEKVEHLEHPEKYKSSFIHHPTNAEIARFGNQAKNK